jgi:ribA/ribD-fused uncharacterized protein
MRLKHLTQDKINSRGIGRKEIRTHQPTGGRGNEGGMRIGEMERDVLIAHGGMAFLKESLMKRSDGTSFYVCNGCGTLPIYNENVNLFVCPLCDGPLSYQGDTSETIGLVLPVKKSRTTFSRVEMPYALKLLDQELTTFMNAGFRFLTEKPVRRFREPTELGYIATTDIEEKETNAIQKEIKDGTTTMAAVAALPPLPAADAGAEDAPADMEDEDAPAHNETEPTIIPEGATVIDFYSGTPQYKEFTSYYPLKLNMEGKIWPTVEHYFQAMKFSGNPDYQETIRKAKTPAAAKRLGKTTDVTVRPDWNTYRITIMETALREKFSERHPLLKQKLINTGSSILRDASPQDNFWGIGRSKKGQNKLGKLLMKIRDELQHGLSVPAVAEASVPVPAVAEASVPVPAVAEVPVPVPAVAEVPVPVPAVAESHEETSQPTLEVTEMEKQFGGNENDVKIIKITTTPPGVKK